MLETFRSRERECLDEGLERAVYHCFEMQFWQRELHQALQESMGKMTQIQSEEAMEAQVDKVAERLQKTSLELLHHTVLLGDELGVTEREWPEAPVDRGAWHRKIRLLMAHVSCGDDCPTSKVCESLGQMVYLARHTMKMGQDVTLEEIVANVGEE